MNPGDEIKVAGYHIAATIEFCEEPGEAIVMHNHSSHFIVAVRLPEDETASFVKAFPYNEDTRYPYLCAIQEAGRQAARR